MGRFIYENLNSTDFENVIIDICKELFGSACKTYSVGKDGGKDSFFEGIAHNYPNASNPWSGKTMIQAKHTAILNASCSENNFFQNQTSIIKMEVSGLKKQQESYPFDNYLIFTNRKLPGTIHLPIKQYIKEELNIKNADIIGREEIDKYLIDYPHIIDRYRLYLNEEPLRFYDEDIKNIIISFHNAKDIDQTTIESDLLYISKEEKNLKNNLSEEYFEHLQNHSLPYFDTIDQFFRDPRNAKYLNMYLNTISELQEKIILERKRYDKFDEILYYLAKYVVNRNDDLLSIRRFVPIFIHYMYFNCDIGKK